MTTKEIAEAVGKPEKTVRTWAKKAAAKSASAAAKLASAGHGVSADYDLDETVAIIEIGMGKNAAALYRESAKQQAPETIAEIVKATVLALIPAIVAAVNGAAPAAKALPAPELAPRDELRRLVNASAEKHGGHREAWGALYQEVYYRLHRNVRQCAKSRGMDTLDYIEDEGLMPEVVAIAREVLAP